MVALKQQPVVLQELDRFIWWRFRDSNPGHADYDSQFLPFLSF